MNNIERLVVERIVRNWKPQKIVLFGSQANGEPSASSDWDFLVVLKDSDIPRYKRAQQIRRCLIDVHVAKDIIVMTEAEWERELRAPASLAANCERNGRTLYPLAYGS